MLFCSSGFFPKGKKKSLLLMSERDHTGKAYFILYLPQAKSIKIHDPQRNASFTFH